MASTERSNNTETDEGTVAFHRKRARRVSFADNEITSVHIFRPDDDHSSSSSDVPHENLGLFRQLCGDSDDEDAERNQNPTDDAAEAVDHRNSFLQPIGSPSPGGSSTNLDEDTDDDEFRGPVSTDFIKPGRLSDSGVSDDITMDSTAFSMHYRSLARSDSGDLKTPTRFDATVTTPGQNSDAPGSYMEFTDGKKKVPHFPVLRSGGGDSDYMSIVGQSETYDYGRLSPGLVAILAHGSKVLDGVTPLGSKATHSPIANDTGFLPNLECSVNSPAQQITHDTAVASTSESSTKNTKEFVNDTTPLACKQLDSAKANRGTPPKMDEGDKFDLAAKYEQGFCEVPVNESNSRDKGQGTGTNHKSDQVTGSHPAHEFKPLSHSANKPVFMGSPDSFRSTGNITPPLEKSGLPVPEVHVANSAVLSSIRTSISKLETHKTTPNTSTLEEGIDKLKHRFSEDRGQGADTNHKSDQVTGSHPVHEFTPLSHSAKKLVFMGSPDTFRCIGNITPPLEESGLPVPEVHVANSVTLSSIRKSISKLTTPKTTPNTSTLKEGIDKLKHRFSNYSPGTSFFSERDFENKQVGTLTAPLEEQPFSLTLENNMHQSLITTDDHFVDSLLNFSKLSQNTETVATKTDEETVATKKDEEINSLVSTNVSDNDKNLKPVDTGASPLLKTHITKVADFDMVDTTAEKRKDEIITAMHAKPFSSPLKSFDHALLPSVECQSNRHGESKQIEIQNEYVNSALGQTIEYDRRTVAKKLDLSGVGNSEQPSSPFEDAQGALKGKPARTPKRFLNLSSPVQAATTVFPSLQETPSDIRDLSHRIDSYGHGVDLDNNYHPTLQAAQSLTKTGIEVSSGGKREDAEILSNGDNRQNEKVSSFYAIREATTVLPSLQKPPSDIRDLSQRYNSDGHGVGFNNNHHPAFQVSQSPLMKTGIEVSSGKKRKGVILSDGDNIDKIGRIDRSPEVHMRGNEDLPFVLEQTSYMRSEREKFGDKKWNDWDQILKRFLTSTEQLLSPSFDKLGLSSSGMLEDILVNLQKVKKWDILSSEIHSQKFADPQNTRHKRVVEVKILLFNIAYERAKLQLMNVKRDRLLKKAQQLSSGLQETQMLKNSMQCSAKSGPVDIQPDESHINTRLLNSQGECQVSYEKRMEMRQELESLDHKAKSLSEFFYSHCKMEGDQSCTDILKSVPDYLEKRMSYKLVFQKLKLWEIEDFERKDDYHLITLNYHGYIIQRFTVNAGLSSIIVSNSLNDVNIGKTYPNMDAISAFLFTLNPHTTSKRTGRIGMAQETQITGSLLSNLLDVVEEVKLARIEIGNLVKAKFNSQSVHQLDLQLSFIDFRGGKKVQVILDMTCLKCGAYPAEVLPAQIYVSTASQAFPSLLVDEIRTAAENVGAGYSRIIRLCRCISQVVRGRTGGI